MEGDSARMIRNVSKISEEQRFCEFEETWAVFWRGGHL
jgi:hypothetical protein